MKTQVKRFQPATGDMQRKVTYRLHLTPGQEAKMLDVKGVHMRLYNAFLEQRRLAWRRQGVSIGRREQSAELTRLRQDDPEIGALNAQSCQVTLNRVDLAFEAFFRRVKAGEEPGYPRFKSFSRMSDTKLQLLVRRWERPRPKSSNPRNGADSAARSNRNGSTNVGTCAPADIEPLGTAIALGFVWTGASSIFWFSGWRTGTRWGVEWSPRTLVLRIST